MNSLDIPTRSCGEAVRSHFETPDQELLAGLYYEQTCTFKEIAKQFEVHRDTIFRWLKRFHMPSRRPRKARTRSKRMPSREALERLYVEEQQSLKNIGQEFSVSSVTISRWLRRLGIPVRTSAESNRARSQRPSREELHRLYWDEFMDARQIGRHFGAHRMTVQKWLRDLDIPTRSHSERRKLVLRQGRSNVE